MFALYSLGQGCSTSFLSRNLRAHRAPSVRVQRIIDRQERRDNIGIPLRSPEPQSIVWLCVHLAIGGHQQHNGTTGLRLTYQIGTSLYRRHKGKRTCVRGRWRKGIQGPATFKAARITSHDNQAQSSCAMAVSRILAWVRANKPPGCTTIYPCGEIAALDVQPKICWFVNGGGFPPDKHGAPNHRCLH